MNNQNSSRPSSKPSERAIKCAEEIELNLLLSQNTTRLAVAQIIDSHNSVFLHALTVAELVIGEFLYDENPSKREDNARSVIETIRELKAESHLTQPEKGKVGLTKGQNERE